MTAWAAYSVKYDIHTIVKLWLKHTMKMKRISQPSGDLNTGQHNICICYNDFCVTFFILLVQYTHCVITYRDCVWVK